jgi:hypothetical protein
MKLFFTLFLLFSSLLNATDENNATTDDKVITIKDTSGLSEEEIRDIALKTDKKTQNRLILNPNKNSTQKVWEQLAPTPVKFDWIELKTGEWLKGKFKAYQDNNLEFDSKKLNLLTFEFKDIYQLRTYKTMTVSIQTKEDQESDFFDLTSAKIQVTGIIRLNRERIKIIQGNAVLEFPREQIISIAHGGESEWQYWSGKITINYNQFIGNTEQLDFNAQAKVQRRTSTTRLILNYMGNIAKKKHDSTADNHRLKETFDLFVTRKFFVTAIALEYYSDPFQNIDQEITAKVAAGYTIARNRYIEWDITGGPAQIQTKYDTVESGASKHSESWAAQFNTKVDIDITKNVRRIFGEYYTIFKDIDLILNYQFTFTDRKSGNYKHHMLSKLENDLTSWLDLDITFIWDYLDAPTANEDGVIPKKDDYQFLVGFGIDF